MMISIRNSELDEPSWGWTKMKSKTIAITYRMISTIKIGKKSLRIDKIGSSKVPLDYLCHILTYATQTL